MIVGDFGDQSSDVSVKEKGQVHKVSFANEAPIRNICRNYDMQRTPHSVYAWDLV